MAQSLSRLILPCGLMLSLLTACPQLEGVFQPKPAKLPGPLTGTGPLPSTPPNDSESQMLAAINAARAVARSCGSTFYPVAPAVSWNSLLAKAALLHSQDMAERNYFAHQTPDGITFDARIQAQGYAWSVAGENIAAGYATLEETIKGWIDSPNHCENLMNPDFKQVGMASFTRVGSKFGVYWTQDFATPR
jgi:uncharacterized protein YkwD